MGNYTVGGQSYLNQNNSSEYYIAEILLMVTLKHTIIRQILKQAKRPEFRFASHVDLDMVLQCI